MRNSPSVSVVIPMYNVERYIQAGIESLKRQTFSDFEVIIVNDGSTDRSREVALRALRDATFPWVIFDQPNQGVSVARNAGLEHARGKYIKYLDADDLLFPKALETLVGATNSGNRNVVVGKYVLRTLKNKTIFTMDRLGKIPAGPQDKRELIIRSLNFRPFIHLGCLLFDRQIVETSGIRFTKGIKISEDVEFITKVFYYSNDIVVVDGLVYDWIRRPHSATRTKSVTMFHHIAVLRRLAKFFEKQGETEISKIIENEVLPLAFVQVIGILAYNRMDYDTWRSLIQHPVVRRYLSTFKITMIREGKAFERLARAVRGTLRLSPGIVYLLLRAVRKYHEFFEK